MAKYAQLSNGSSGSDVKKMQKALIAAGYDVGSAGADGIYGPDTEAAVRKYQKAKGLDVDGIAGDQTLGSLYSSSSSSSSSKKSSSSSTKAKKVTAPKAMTIADTGVTEAKLSPAETAPAQVQSLSSNPNLTSAIQTAKPAQAQPGIQGVTQDTQQAINQWQNADYTQNRDVVNAQNTLNATRAAKPGEYQDTYQQQLSNIMNQISNGEKFTYDLNGDLMYQQYKDQYQNLGRQAMMDTAGQAAALTGGYGNSYGTSAASQAYQGYLQKLNEVIPQLYDRAYQRYQNDRQALYDQYNMYRDASNADYGRYRDTVSDWQYQYGMDSDVYQSALNRAQSDYWNRGDFLTNQRAAENQNYWNQMDYNYQMSRDATEDQWRQREYDYQMARDEAEDSRWAQEYDYQRARDKVADQQWQMGYDYDVARDEVEGSRWQSELDYQAMRDTTSDEQWLKELEYQKARDKKEDEQWEKEYELAKKNLR